MSLKCENISAHHPGNSTATLKNVSLSVPTGEICAVLGPSGSGKTTLLRVIAGLHTNSSGAVIVGDKDLSATPVQHRGIGVVPQQGALFGHLTVAANIGFGLKLRTHRSAVKDPRVQRMLTLTGMAEFAARYPHQLSGGQQQRVALARALAPEPQVLLLDEPFSALDASLRESLRTEVRDLLHSLGITALLITHDRTEAFSFADHVALLHDGAVVDSGTPVSVYRHPSCAWSASFLGDATLLPCSPSAQGSTCALGELTVAEGCPAQGLAVVRPEMLEVELSGNEGQGVLATIEGVEHRGDKQVLRLTVPEAGRMGGDGGVAITANAAPFPTATVGTTASISVSGPVHVVAG
ncbi:MAG TPA: ABC transporter ATP-binding protein [Candidatus Corynebacterium gallistercoris]|uniref:ABC-type quaternary amine transporter n=1 Tax=Candidatus Corynebacterium gallistercoris TaxID=2838530 RepID=A0A9D1RZB2_9CORY|nr:ABC transporter ATP-binding protein [Candidatus Corynebacterium gallistercoris]